MENVRNRMKMQLVSDEKKCAKLINRNTFKDITIYNNKLAAIHLNMDVLQFDKPIYVGFSILDLSKTLIYDFHYNSMVENYGSNIQLMYMDTGAYHISTVTGKKGVNDILNENELIEFWRKRHDSLSIEPMIVSIRFFYE